MRFSSRRPKYRRQENALQLSSVRATVLNIRATGPELECKPVKFGRTSWEVTNEQTRIFGDNGGCRGREHKSGLRGPRRATRPDRRANNGIAAPAARSAFRRPLSGRSPGVDEEAEGFVRTV